MRRGAAMIFLSAEYRASSACRVMNSMNDEIVLYGQLLLRPTTALLKLSFLVRPLTWLGIDSTGRVHVTDGVDATSKS